LDHHYKTAVYGTRIDKELILSIDSTSLDHFFRVFFSIPWYRTKPQYQLYLLEYLELHPKRNPFFREHCSYVQYWVAYQNQQPIGRIAAWIDDKYDTILPGNASQKTGWIGLFECISDKTVAHELLETACESLRRKGVATILGPGRFNASSQIGLQIQGFDSPPSFMEPFHPPYYEPYFSAYGQKVNDWFSFGVEENSFQAYLERIHKNESRYGSLEDQLQRKGIQVYSPTKKNLAYEVDRIVSLYNDLWTSPEHPQFSPLCFGEKKALQQAITLFWEPSLIHIAQTKDRVIVGIGITVPDINEAFLDFSYRFPLYPSKGSLLIQDLRGFFQMFLKIHRRRFTRARVLILGSNIPFSGLESALYKNLYQAVKERGIQKISASQIADTNLPMMNPLRKMGSIEKVWRVYQLQ
jgi:hypothetical protein